MGKVIHITDDGFKIRFNGNTYRICCYYVNDKVIKYCCHITRPDFNVFDNMANIEYEGETLEY